MNYEDTYRFVPVTERLPTKSGSFICHILVKEDGMSYWPVTYNEFNIDNQEWNHPSICGTSGEIVDWLEKINL
jgi:hypothetical protein